MTIPTTFALSLELSRLVPLSLVSSEAAQAVMRLAGDLQNAGSDIVIEEDLAGLLGRARISQQFTGSFKTAGLRSGFTKLCDGLVLQSGSGSTVVRSFQHTPYFSMVVQYSLLAYCHQISSLAGIFAQRVRETSRECPSRGSDTSFAISRRYICGVGGMSRSDSGICMDKPHSSCIQDIRA